MLCKTSESSRKVSMTAEKTNPLQIKALKSELPWVGQYIDSYRPDIVRVARVDTNILKLHFEFEPGRKHKFQKLLDKEGSVLLTVGTFNCPAPKKTVWQSLFKIEPKPYQEIRDDNVESALLRLGDQIKDVAYILQYEFRQVGGAKDTHKLTIHKAPKGYSVPEWIEKLTEDARSTLRETLGRIDAV